MKSDSAPHDLPVATAQVEAELREAEHEVSGLRRILERCEAREARARTTGKAFIGRFAVSAVLVVAVAWANWPDPVDSLLLGILFGLYLGFEIAALRRGSSAVDACAFEREDLAEAEERVRSLRARLGADASPGGREMTSDGVTSD